MLYIEINMGLEQANVERNYIGNYIRGFVAVL